MKTKLSTQPYKGARDFYPEEMRIRNYIFNIWRKTALLFGFEEYDFPFLEPIELYKAKSGEELVNKQIYSFTDRGGRNIAVRPEKTPSVARMYAAKINEIPKPVKWFNIGNCWRYEKPQKGRGREFFQFDCDIFGVDGVEADVEVFSIPIEIMKTLGAKPDMFEVRIANRELAEFYLKNEVKLDGGISIEGTTMYKVGKAVDEKPKISEKEFLSKLENIGLSKEQVQKLVEFIEGDLKFVDQFREKSKGAKDLLKFFELAKKRGYDGYFSFRPEVMRGLDYYSGNVIEQFDLNPQNNRSMYGGGRYDNLVSIFLDQKVSGVGFAMGDVTLLEFLKGWNLLPKFENETRVFVTMFSPLLEEKTTETTLKLRSEGINTSMCLEFVKLDKQLKYADKKGIRFAIIIGPDENEKGVIKLKDLKTKDQKVLTLAEAINVLKK